MSWFFEMYVVFVSCLLFSAFLSGPVSCLGLFVLLCPVLSCLAWSYCVVFFHTVRQRSYPSHLFMLQNMTEPAEKKMKTEKEEDVICFKKLSDTARLPEKGSAQAAGVFASLDLGSVCQEF
jgi:hypothetical protein